MPVRRPRPPKPAAPAPATTTHATVQVAAWRVPQVNDGSPARVALPAHRVNAPAGRFHVVGSEPRITGALAPTANGFDRNTRRRRGSDRRVRGAEAGKERIGGGAITRGLQHRRPAATPVTLRRPPRSESATFGPPPAS